MPQIEQLNEIFASQLFWLAVVFGIILAVVGYGMVPKILGTVEARDARIAEDLATAERARAAADETEEAYRERINAVRTEALKLVQQRKQEAARETERRMAESDAAAREKIEAAEARLREATDAALAEVEQVAAEAAREMVGRLAGFEVSPEEAAQAVKAAAHG